MEKYEPNKEALKNLLSGKLNIDEVAKIPNLIVLHCESDGFTGEDIREAEAAGRISDELLDEIIKDVQDPYAMPTIFCWYDKETKTLIPGFLGHGR